MKTVEILLKKNYGLVVLTYLILYILANASRTPFWLFVLD